ncbi:MAG: peptidylprolyl isomerase, partial [Planctomycetota bacterium]|nr:peptidylprolyl isomerase [Planctomycetota bacterium]
MATASSLSAQEERRVSHILVESKAKADEIRKEVIAGGGDAKAFKAACYKYSKDPTTKRLGGDLGFIRKNSGYDPRFSAATFNLKEGGISAPVISNFGWHLIHVIQVRNTAPAAAAKPATPAQNPVEKAAQLAAQQAASARKKAGEATAGQAPAKPAATPAKPAATPAKPATTPATPATTPAKTEPAKTAPAKPAAVKPAPVVRIPAKRRVLSPKRSVTLTLESILSGFRSRGAQLNFRKEVAVELNLTLRNGGRADAKVPSPELLPLGFDVVRLSDNKPMQGDFVKVGKPANYFVNLKSWEITGLVVSLNDYFPTLTPSGRYSVNWSGVTFARNIESRFPDVKSLPNFSALRAEILSRQYLRTRKVFQDRSSNRANFGRNSFEFSVFDSPAADTKYYARVNFSIGGDPVVFELSASKPRGGNLVALQQFVDLANEGFYDRLNFYDVQEGNYALGGCPSRNGMGVPPQTRSGLKNDDEVKHTAGTVSFVTRVSPRVGKANGGEVGSIFFVSLKDHPEWDSEHVPIGKVVEGLDRIGKLTAQSGIASIVILTEAEYNGESPDVALVPVPVAPATPDGITTGEPEVLITTSKGDLNVTLFESKSVNAVNSFITLAEKGFFSDGPGDGK